MKFWTILLKLMALDNPASDLQLENKSIPTTDHKPHPQDDSNRPTQPIIRDQKLLTLYKVMDMGA